MHAEDKRLRRALLRAQVPLDHVFARDYLAIMSVRVRRDVGAADAASRALWVGHHARGACTKRKGISIAPSIRVEAAHSSYFE